jgi:hypothetical protein
MRTLAAVVVLTQVAALSVLDCASPQTACPSGGTASPASSALAARVERLEARIAALENPEPKKETPRAQLDDPDAGGPRSETPAEARAHAAVALESTHDEAVAAFRVEPIDPAWAPSAADSLQADLTRRRPGTALQAPTAVSVVCRSSSCLATLTFADYHAAMGALSSLGEGMTRMNCGWQPLCVEPSDGGAPYSCDVLLAHCAR